MIGVSVTYWRHRQESTILPLGQGDSSTALLGRTQDLALLDQAWYDESINLFLLNALGGTGKTSLLQAWLSRMEQADWGEASRVYVWSFPDLHTDDALLTISEEFINHALDWFSCGAAQPAHLLERIQLLCKLVQRHRTLLVLDNFPTLEFELDGAEISQPLGILMNCLAAYNPGLCVIAARTPGNVCDTFRPYIVQHTLPELSPEAGVTLLQQQGVMLMPASLRKLSEDFCGHPLTLELVASYLTNGGTFENIQAILAWRDKEREGLQTRRILAVLEQWLWKTPELLLLYLLSLLDRPVTHKELYLLLRSQRQPWLKRWLKPDETLNALEPLSKLSLRDFSRLQRRLYKMRLLTTAPDSGALDIHSLLRSYFRERVRARFPGVPNRLQGLLDKCVQTLNAIMPPEAPALSASRAERLGFTDMQAAVKATRALGIKLEKSALQKHWYRAAIIANHLCEHHLILGNMSAAVYCARRGVAYAELSHDKPSLIQNMQQLTRLLCVTGGGQEAVKLLERARQVCGVELSTPRLSRQAA